MITITEDYQRQQQKLHENPNYGIASVFFAPIVAEIIEKFNVKSLSDYGAGKQRLNKTLVKNGVFLQDYFPYDPAFPDYGMPTPADLVCCIDVLEHIEPDLIDNVLVDLMKIVTKIGFFTIHLGPAAKILDDGRNAHLIQQPAEWWLKKMNNYFEVVDQSPHKIQGNGLCVIVAPKKQESKIDVSKYEKMKPSTIIEVDKKELLYNTPNSNAVWRVQTLFTKEPSTIQWLNRLNDKTILIDVGANVGMYSIYAAKLKNARVFAFEPESQNYSLLLKNIISNELQDLITAFPVSLSDEIKLDTLHLSKFIWDGGGSCHSFGEEVGFDLKYRNSQFTQGSISYTIDKAISEGVILQPTHIKLDVDGFEHKVMRGAFSTLRDEKLRSLCIEINPNLSEHLELIRELKELGFLYNMEQVASVERQSGPFKGCAEYIFDRLIDPKIKVFGSTLNSNNLKSDIHEKAQKHCIEKITQAKIEESPYPYVVIDNIFPEDYYNEILRLFPEADKSIALGETGRVTPGGYMDRKVTLFTEDHFNKLSEDQRIFWANFSEWIYSEEFIRTTLSRFYPWCINKLADIQDRKDEIKLKCDALLVHDNENYAIGPHTDANHRLLTFLFYTPKDASDVDLGTSIYECKDSSFICPGGKHYQFDEFNEIKKIPFIPNRLLCFVRTGKSFHGVDKIIKKDVDRKLIINNIRLLDQ
jgi:FkbM family methyltransferase